MDDARSTKPAESHASSEDAELDAILRAVAHAPPRRPPAEPVPQGTRWGAGGRYVIEGRLGRGGMGTVYSATDTLLGRVVALKVLDLGDSDDDALRARLLREARLAAPIEHERIARVYDVGEHERTLFVAMELVRGLTLRRWMSGREATAGEIAAIGSQIAEGLGALHERGVFHRDLKPENVMLSDQGGIRLLDFGLARPVGHAGGEGEGGNREPPSAFAGGESVAAFSGTPGYMAPEQCAGGALDARVDVFALGVILYELVTGARPFGGGGERAVLEATLQGAPVFAPEAWQRVPPRLRDVTARMLARDPSDRFADGSAALEALREVGPDPVMPAVLQGLDEAEGPAAPAPSRRRRVGVALAIAAPLGALALALALGRVVHPVSPPRPPPLQGMAWIDVGTLEVGRDTADLDRECAAIGPGCDRELMQREAPSEKVTLAPFQLDVHEVTNEEMVATLNTLGASLHVEDCEKDHYPRYVRWSKELAGTEQFLLDLYRDGTGIEYTADRTFRAKPGFERLPVVQVTWHGAQLFCATRGKFLPTEDEWEAAARGRGNRPYPWGSAPLRCGEVIVPRDGLIPIPPACPEKMAVAPVGQAAEDVTPEGIHDLGGNVSEWVDSTYTEGNRAAHVDGGAQGRPKVLRGGSFAESLMARTSGRNRRIADVVATNVGFRCAVR
jgi:formylglycine-generating enzyme required for sulfatase activity/predicted Ser/Thr protein kinase